MKRVDYLQPLTAQGSMPHRRRCILQFRSSHRLNKARCPTDNRSRATNSSDFDLKIGFDADAMLMHQMRIVIPDSGFIPQIGASNFKITKARDGSLSS
jgi:hypothetical protein